MQCKNHPFIIGIILIIMIISGTLHAQISQWEKQLEADSTNTELLLKLGKSYHDKAGSGTTSDAVDKAEKYLSRLIELDSDNALALVYYGSTLTMKARDASMPWDKMKYMKLGFARMDRAVKIAPDNVEVRLIRGINSASVPGMFKRLKFALQDFKQIAQMDQRNLTAMTNKFWLPYFYYYGLALMKEHQDKAARENFSKVIEIDPECGLAKHAQLQLEKIK